MRRYASLLLGWLILGKVYPTEPLACEQLRTIITTEVSAMKSGLAKDLLRHWLDEQPETHEGKLLVFAIKRKYWSLRSQLPATQGLPQGVRNYLEQLSRHQTEPDASSLQGLWRVAEAYRLVSLERYAKASAEFMMLADNQQIPETIRAALAALAALYDNSVVAKQFGGGMAASLRACLATEQGARKNFFTALRRWQQLLPGVQRQSGHLLLQGESRLEIEYAGNHEELKLILRRDGRTVMEARPQPVFNAGKSWQLNEIITVDGTAPAGLQLEFVFSKEIGGGNFDLNLRGHAGRGVLRTDWQGLINIFLETPGMVQHSDTGYLIAIPAAGGLFPDVFLRINFHEGFPVEITLEKRRGLKLGFRELAFNDNAKAPFFGSKPIMVDLPLPMQTLDLILSNNLFTGGSAKSTTQQELYRDLSLHANNQSSPLQLAQKYSAQAAKNGNLALFAGYFYAAAYDFAAACREYERYFLSREQNEHPEDISFSVMFPVRPEIAYLGTLVQQGLYDEAANFALFLQQSAEVRRKISESLNVELALADIYLRAANYPAAEVTLRRLIEKARGNDMLEMARLANLRLLVLQGYRGKSPESVNPEEYPAQAAELVSALAVPGKSPVGLPQSVVLPGEGRNFCAPATLQFVIRALTGKVISQKEIAGELKTTEQGTELRSILEYLRWNGFNVRVFAADPHEVASHLQKEEPVVALLWPPESTLGHIAPILAVDTSREVYYFYEPAQPFGIAALTAREFTYQQAQVGSILVAISRGELPGSAKATLLLVDFFDKFLQAPPNDRLRHLEEIAAADEQGKYAAFVTAQRALAYSQLSDSQTLTAQQKRAALELLTISRPQSPQEYKALAELAVRAGQPEQAKIWLKASLELRPGDFFSWLRLAEIELNQNRRAEARESLRAVLRHAPADAPPRLWSMVLQQLAVLASLQGNKKEALALYGWAMHFAGNEQDILEYRQVVAREISAAAAEFLQIMAGIAKSE